MKRVYLICRYLDGDIVFPRLYPELAFTTLDAAYETLESLKQKYGNEYTCLIVPIYTKPILDLTDGIKE